MHEYCHFICAGLYLFLSDTGSLRVCDLWTWGGGGGACETQVLSNKCQASPVGECQAVEVLGQ